MLKSILGGAYIRNYHIALNFRGSLISRNSWIFNCSRKYFNENVWHVACGVHVQRIRETKSSKITFRENLDPPKFSAIQYTVNSHHQGTFFLFTQPVHAFKASYQINVFLTSACSFLWITHTAVCAILKYIQSTRRIWHSHCVHLT